jgi:hypothetical protein
VTVPSGRKVYRLVDVRPEAWLYWKLHQGELRRSWLRPRFTSGACAAPEGLGPGCPESFGLGSGVVGGGVGAPLVPALKRTTAPAVEKSGVPSGPKSANINWSESPSRVAAANPRREPLVDDPTMVPPGSSRPSIWTTVSFPDNSPLILPLGS